ncbi:hemerythrin domain-containing protein [Aeromicrobium phragmitis]|uniref:Hemerythrin domain-containing protein n=1 Tax=Aeromicrobium phragmitis TaxID=2478914 RepID=A0A3L8PJV8_9ACTN|nr:hemerythrin domain-containing protein [Aeromicrobium phragmitis]RLV54993.1 hemerythrin domain-containing protein [Aeromicrobium phragmitis]
MDANDRTAGEDVTDILTTDHRQMLELLAEIEQSTDPERRRDLADTVIAEVMRHAIAEEMFVYPAMEEHVPNGREEVEHDKQEHDEIVQVMKKLEDVDAEDPRFMELARELEAQLRHHADDEESEQFPKLREHIPHDERVQLGDKVQNAKKVAPTRPHPHAPHSELFHKAVGPGVGMVDRLLDKLTGRHTG